MSLVHQFFAELVLVDTADMAHEMQQQNEQPCVRGHRAGQHPPAAAPAMSNNNSGIHWWWGEPGTVGWGLRQGEHHDEYL